MVKTVMIVGGNRGLGLEAVRQYAEAGWRVVVSCRQPDTADQLRTLADIHPTVDIVSLDVANAEAVEDIGQQLASTPIDILFHNAGVGEFDRNLSGLDVDAWQYMFLVNSIAPILVARALLPSIRKGQQKTIAFMTSKMGSLDDNTSGGVYAYRSSKAALNMGGKSLALDLRGESIKVLLMHPGWVRTDMGGPNALIDVEESISGLRRVLDNLTIEDSGSFMDYRGRRIKW